MEARHAVVAEEVGALEVGDASPRYTTPPVTEHQPSSWRISNTGGAVPLGDPARVVTRSEPS